MGKDQSVTDSSIFRPLYEPGNFTSDPGALRGCALKVTALIAEGTLRVGWTYGSRLHTEATIARVAGEFMQALKVLIDHCQSPDAGGFTPSDFPLAGLDDEELDRLSRVIGDLDDG